MSILPTEISITQKPNYRQAGKEKSGKIVKGPIQDSLNKTNTASIPYKFETILYKNVNPRGFGQSAARFFQNEDLAPGPGSYDFDQYYDNTVNPSISKKGWGTFKPGEFVGKPGRKLYDQHYVNTGPGPGAYKPIERPFQVTHISPDPSINTTRTTIDTTKTQSELPGPGHYKVENVITSSVHEPRAISSVFKSQSLRSLTSSRSNIVPAVGIYEIDRSLTAKKPFQHHLNSAPFMIPTKKKMSDQTAQKQVTDHLLEKDKEVVKGNPGPGTYFSQKEDEVALFNQRLNDKLNANFMPGNTTRFGDAVVKKARRIITPGPGAYGSIYLFSQDKALVSGSVFISETARRSFAGNGNIVGPTKYNPEPLPKKSYHLNINKQWV